jgi:hypothetical protein
MEYQKAICPNCGANITNMQNCEFCGSLLIRLQQQGINIESAGYKDDSRVFQGLVGALKRNLDLQKATNHSIAVSTDIYVEQNGKDRCLSSVIMKLETQDHKLFFPNSNYDKDHLMIVFQFFPNNESGHELRLRKFRNLDIYELFTENISFTDDDGKAYEYAIDFGGDAEGAAQLISKVIHEVYAIPYETKIDCYTNSGNDIDKSREIMMGETSDGETPGIYKWLYYAIMGLSMFLFSRMCD